MIQNDEPWEQTADLRDQQRRLEELLGFNDTTFTQIALLGSRRWQPFMQLKAQDRRVFVENLLDLQVFSVMNSLLKDKVKTNADLLAIVNQARAVVTGKIGVCRRKMDERTRDVTTDIEEKQRRIEALNEEATNSSTRAAGLLEQAKHIELPVPNQSRWSNLVSLKGEITSKMQTLKQEVQFLRSHDTCPTCTQEIAVAFKENRIEKHTANIIEMETAIVKLDKDIAELKRIGQEHDRAKEQIASLEKSAAIAKQEAQQSQSSAVYLSREITSLQRRTEEHEDSELPGLEIELTKVEAKLSSVNQEKLMLDVAGSLLKDGGIKAKIVAQYVPVINSLANKYLANLDFFCEFHLDEAFEETIRSRHRDRFAYENFSEGEKLRIAFALMFTWRAIAKMRGSPINLLIMDEVLDSALDQNGADELLKLISNLTGDTNLYIISHKRDIYSDKFNQILAFEKQGNFTRIAA